MTDNPKKLRHRSLEYRRDEYRLGLAGTVEGRTNEFRQIAGSPTVGFELRGSPKFAGKGIVATGDVCRYLDPTTIFDSFGSYREQVLRGAASHLLASGNLRTPFLVNHNRDDLPLARVPSTMSFEDTPTALRFQAVLDTRMSGARDLVCAMENGIIQSTSWAFSVDKDGGDVWHGADKGSRDLVRFADIYDVSAVTTPAYANAGLALADTRKKKAAVRLPCRVCGGARRLYPGGPPCASCKGSGFQRPDAGIDGTQNTPASPGGSMGGDGSGTRAALELQLHLLRMRRPYQERPLKRRKVK